jgi:hypothetical protein
MRFWDNNYGIVDSSVLGRTVEGKPIFENSVCKGTIIAANGCVCNVETNCGKVVNMQWNNVTFTDGKARGGG